jgi:hypothetical protein
MMMDGVPDRCGLLRARPLILSGASTQRGVAAGDVQELAAGIR